MTTIEPLTAAEMAILEFERIPWKYAGKKDEAIFDWFGIRATTYYARLNRIIDQAAAEVYDPPLVRRLRRLRTARQAARSARHQGVDAAGGAR